MLSLIRRYRDECQGKVRHRKKAAFLEAARLRDKMRHEKIQHSIHAYECPHCHAWHCGRVSKARLELLAVDGD